MDLLEMLGGGGAANAGQQIQDRGYQIYAQEAMANGQEPLPIEQWRQMHGVQQQTPQQPAPTVPGAGAGLNPAMIGDALRG